MIITLICFGILLVGVLLNVFYRVCDNHCCKTTKQKKFCIKVSHSCIDSISFVAICIGTIASLVCSMTLICSLSCKQIDYEKALYTKKTIEYRIEHKDENLIGNENLYNDIIGFNNDLRSIKYWVNNNWTSWFNNDKIAQLDYIEYELAED